MSFVSEPLDLPESAFIILRDLIHDYTGLYYDLGKRYLLADKLSHRVIERGLDSFLDYYYLLKYDATADEEWKQLMNALSVPETFFWREIDQIEALVKVLLPEYFTDVLKRFSYSQPVRIWSAACASGEEPLSIAIALNEAGWFYHNIEIYASDASATAIAKAKQGLYRERSFRSLPPELKNRYFTQEENGWRVSAEIHKRIHWGTANLLSASEIELFTNANFIFCRNVFIYFSDRAINQTVRRFYEGMPRPGYLFVGSSESLLKTTTEFELREIGDAFVYVKS